MKRRPKINRRFLKDLREHRGWSLEEAAWKIGISRQSLNYIERGVVQPRGLTVVHLAQAYGVSSEQFYDREAVVR